MGILRLVKGSILRSISKCGGNRAMIYLTRQRPRILTYHGVVRDRPSVFNWQQIDERAFEAQMLYVKKNFQVVSLTELLEEVSSGTVTRRNLLAITFDDGYENNYSVAYPILKRLRLPATFFVCTKPVEAGGQGFWFDAVYDAICSLPRTEVDLSEIGFGKLDLSSDELKAHVVSDLVGMLKLMRSEVRNAKLTQLLSSLAQDKIVAESFPSMNWRQVKEMAADPLIMIGGHGHSHVILTGLDKEAVKDEVEINRTLLMTHCETAIDIFAYPNGDWNSDVAGAVDSAGYRYAVTTREDFVRKADLSVPRLTVRNPSSMMEFEALVSGLVPTLRRVK